MDEGIVHAFEGYVKLMSNLWNVWLHHIYLDFRTIDIFIEWSVGFRNTEWV